MYDPVSEPIRVFIGYDNVEAIAFHVLSHSINRLSSNPVSITPLMTNQLESMYWRPRDVKQSNDFSFSRFLVPWICGYEGWAIFMDCDMLCRTDISKLWNLRDHTKSVQVVKHDYTPKNDTKYLGNVQHKYEKKNWSSMMIFNNKRCQNLTPTYVNNATGLELHQFKWTDENMVGDIPTIWNHLVGEYEYDNDANLVHFTVGGPYFSEYENCHYSAEWFNEKMLHENCEQLPVSRVKVSEK